MRTTLISLLSLSLLASPAIADTPPPAPPAPAAPAPPAPAAPAPAPSEAPANTTAPDEIRSVSAANLPPPRAPGASLISIDLAQLPARCHPIAKRARASQPAQALTARIALANCTADVKLAELELIDGAESIVAIDEAMAPSLALLDDVATATDPATRVMAHHAKAQLYTGMTMRMLNTVPPATDATPAASALRDSRRAIVESLVTSWREQAIGAHQVVVDLAKAHPALARNPVVQTAVRESRARLAQRSVATR